MGRPPAPARAPPAKSNAPRRGRDTALWCNLTRPISQAASPAAASIGVFHRHGVPAGCRTRSRRTGCGKCAGSRSVGSSRSGRSPHAMPWASRFRLFRTHSALTCNGRERAGPHPCCGAFPDRQYALIGRIHLPRMPPIAAADLDQSFQHVLRIRFNRKLTSRVEAARTEIDRSDYRLLSVCYHDLAVKLGALQHP